MSQTSQSRRRCSPARRSAGNSSPIKPTMHVPFASVWPKGERLSCDVQIRRSPPIQRLKSIHALRFWEFPCAAQDFGARAIESHHVIPARHSRQTIRNLAVAAAELNRDRAVRVFLRGDVVDRRRVNFNWAGRSMPKSDMSLRETPPALIRTFWPVCLIPSNARQEGEPAICFPQSVQHRRDKPKVQAKERQGAQLKPMDNHPAHAVPPETSCIQGRSVPRKRQ